MPRSLPPRQAAARGWTLVEACIAGAIAAIVLALALPSMAALRERLQVQAILHEIAASLALARTHAVQRGVPTTACPSADGLRCRDDGDWSAGWMVYADPGRQDHPASASMRIAAFAPLPAWLELRGSIGRPRLRYRPDGMAGGHNQSLRLCGRGADARLHGTIVVNRGGRPRVERPPGPQAPC